MLIIKEYKADFFFFFFFTERKVKGLANLVCTVCVAWSPTAVFTTVKENQ